MRPVILESPFSGDVARNLEYLRACMHDCLARGDSPYASHGLLTQPGVLDDTIPEERELGIRAGFVWRELAAATVVYIDLGVTRGMQYGIEHCQRAGRDPEYRTLGGVWASPDARPRP